MEIDFPHFLRGILPPDSIGLAIHALSLAAATSLIQWRTLASPIRHRSFEWKTGSARYVLNVLFSSSILCLLPAIALVLILALHALSLVALLQYFRVFGKPLLHPLIWLRSIGRVDPRALVALLPPKIGVLAVLFWVVQSSLVARGGYRAPGLGLLLLGAWGAFVIALSRVLKTKYGNIRTHCNLNVFGAVFGYTGLWLATHLNQRLSRREWSGWIGLSGRSQLDRCRSNGFQREQAIKNVVVVQVESLSLAPLLPNDKTAQTVAPFLCSLKERSGWLRLPSDRRIPSFQADFSVLTGVDRDEILPSYSAAANSLERCDSLARLAADAGFRTGFFHGATGDFYGRRLGMQRLGFDELHFLEELEQGESRSGCAWGITDDDLCRAALQRMTAYDGRSFQMIVTVSSHSPYRFCSSANFHLSKAESYPPLLRDYLLSIRYVDEVLERFLCSLPPDSVCIIYGDHAPADLLQWATDCPGIETVPVLGFNLQSSIAELAECSTGDIQTFGSLSQLIGRLLFSSARG